MIRLLRPRGQRWHRYDPTIIVPLLVLSIVLAATTAHAQTTTWTGGGTSNNWSDSGNWDNGVPQNGYDVYFSPVSTDSYVDIPGLTLNRLDMNGYSGTLWLDEDISTADYCRIDGFFYTGEQSLNVGTDLIVMNSGGFSADFTNISVANSLSIAGYIAFYF
ncbi:MAG: hypothetical protein PVF33_10885, partial [Candidatus Latescibacterota bacterium]